jgi:hypothetical protein
VRRGPVLHFGTLWYFMYRTRGRLVPRCTVTTKLAPSTNCFWKTFSLKSPPKNTEFFAKFVNTVITTALDYVVPMTTHYSTLDHCHPLLMMMMIHPQMHHQVMLPHHDQDLLSCTNLFQYGIEFFIPDLFCIQSFCSGTWPKRRRESLF